MKKNNEGYALPFVLVVMVVLGLVAVSAMSAPLRNLQTQQALVERMQDRYAAEGEIEKVIAQLSDAESMKALQGENAKEAIKTKIGLLCGEAATIGETVTVAEEGEFEYPFQLTYEHGSATVSCSLTFNGTIESATGSGTKTYEITPERITYNSYEITYGGDA